MPNDDEIAGRGGLLPVNFPYGNYRRNLYKLTTSTTAAVYIGEPMSLDASGQVAPATPSTAAAGSKILGSALGFTDTNKAGIPSGMTALDQGGFLPANTDAYVIVSDDPEQLYQIQEDTGGSALTQSSVGNTGVFVYRSSSGNNTTGYATAEFDRSTVVATGSGHLQIVGLVDRMNSDGSKNDFGNYAKLLVRISQPNFGALQTANPAV